MMKLQLLLDGKSTDIIDFSGKYGQPLASEKYDGVYCYTVDDLLEVKDAVGRGRVTRALSRNNVFIPNDFIREQLDTLPGGLHGELILVGAEFNESSGAVRKFSGEPDFKFKIFNYTGFVGPFIDRIAAVKAMNLPSFVEVVEQIPVRDKAHLEEIIQQNKEIEGIVVTYSDVEYHHGRCSKKKPFSVRFKNMIDDEFQITGVIQETFTDTALNRSLNRVGIGQGFAGSYICITKTGLTFHAPIAVSKLEAEQIWTNKSEYIGQLAKVRYLPVGGGKVPRLPVCIGLREI